MQINSHDLKIVWNGSHTAEVYNELDTFLDVFTFSFEKNNPSQIDFVSSAMTYLWDL